MKRLKHVVTDYGVEGWVPDRLEHVVPALICAAIIFLSGGVVGWLVGVMQCAYLAGIR